MKQRKISKSKVKCTYSFYSHKAGESFLLESTLEYFACFLLEYKSKVQRFAPQPMGFYYNEFGRRGFYTPDFIFLLLLSIKKTYLEIKPKKIVDDPVFQDLFECKKTRAQELGYDLEYMTEDDICQEPYLSNLMLLHSYNTKTPKVDVDFLILETLEKYQELEISQVAEAAEIDSKQTLARLYCLIARGEVSPKLSIHDHKLNLSSVISISTESNIFSV